MAHPYTRIGEGLIVWFTFSYLMVLSWSNYCQFTVNCLFSSPLLFMIFSTDWKLHEKWNTSYSVDIHIHSSALVEDNKWILFVYVIITWIFTFLNSHVCENSMVNFVPLIFDDFQIGCPGAQWMKNKFLMYFIILKCQGKCKHLKKNLNQRY